MAPIEPSSATVSRRGQPSSLADETDSTVVWLHGEHDIATVATLSEVMVQAIALDDGDLVVDLRGVEFMDAATVGVIMRARGLLRLRSRSLVLRSPSRCARRLLELCGLAHLVVLPPAEVMPPAGLAGALGTWVAVPGGDRVDRLTHAPSPEPGPATISAGARARTTADRRGP
jgi:anti-anti-sigma factor